ncbi:MAG: hypothetical protein ABIA37_04265 [Candidatus Woesearchaeota archaeon]
MGREAYLFGINVHKTEFIKLEQFLEKQGFKEVEENIGWKNFELVSEGGILEIQFVKEETNFYLRFAIINPDTIVELLGELFNGLRNMFEVKIYDYEQEKFIDDLSEVKERLLKKRREYLRDKKIQLIPIRAGHHVFDYLRGKK